MSCIDGPTFYARKQRQFLPILNHSSSHLIAICIDFQILSDCFHIVLLVFLQVDFDSIAQILKNLDDHCKRSWEHLRLIAKHDSSSPLKMR